MPLQKLTALTAIGVSAITADDEVYVVNSPDSSPAEFSSSLTVLAEGLAKAKKIFTPEMYGAIGNGTTDDTVAIKAAYTAARAAQNLGMSSVHFTGGKTYLVTSPIDVSWVHSIGNGAVIKAGATFASATFNGMVVNYLFYQSTGVAFGTWKPIWYEIQGFIFNGNDVCGGVYIGGSRYTVRNNMFYNCKHAAAIRFDKSINSAVENGIRDCHIGIWNADFYGGNASTIRLTNTGGAWENSEIVRDSTTLATAMLVSHVHGATYDTLTVTGASGDFTVGNTIVGLTSGVSDVMTVVADVIYRGGSMRITRNFIQTSGIGVLSHGFTATSISENCIQSCQLSEIEYVGGQTETTAFTIDRNYFESIPSDSTDWFAQGTHAGLEFYYGAGLVRGASYNMLDVVAGHITLANNVTNYIQVNDVTGVVSVNSSAFTVTDGVGFIGSEIPLYTVVTAASVIGAIVDYRPHQIVYVKPNSAGLFRELNFIGNYAYGKNLDHHIFLRADASAVFNIIGNNFRSFPFLFRLVDYNLTSAITSVNFSGNTIISGNPVPILYDDPTDTITANIFLTKCNYGENKGILAKKNGTATILSGQTSIVVTHGLGYTARTPDPPITGIAPQYVRVTALETVGSGLYVDTFTTTQFTIHSDAAVAADTDIAWTAWIGK